jgi:hypothetical protein
VSPARARFIDGATQFKYIDFRDALKQSCRSRPRMRSKTAPDAGDAYVERFVISVRSGGEGGTFYMPAFPAGIRFKSPKSRIAARTSSADP